MAKGKKINTMMHHCVYAYNGVGNHEQIDIKVPIYTTEHHILTELQRRGKNVSWGFLQALRYFLWERETMGTYVILQPKCENTIKNVKGKGEEYEPDSNNK